MNVLEDEYHFVLVCPAYRSFRSLYLPRYYCSWPNRQKLYKNLTIKFCRYLNSAWKLRLEIIQWTLSYCSLLSVCFYVILYVHVCYSMYVLFANKEFNALSYLKDFKLFGFPIFLLWGIPDENYSRNAMWAQNYRSRMLLKVVIIAVDKNDITMVLQII